MVRVMKVRAIVDEQVLYITEHLIHHFNADISDDAGVLYHIGQTILHQL